jgi:hypothetical protein
MKGHKNQILLSAAVWLASTSLSVAAEATATASAETGTEAKGGNDGPEELEAANAVLFLFAGLAFGLIFRRGLTGLIIPYTGILVVRFKMLTNQPDATRIGDWYHRWGIGVP